MYDCHWLRCCYHGRAFQSEVWNGCRVEVDSFFVDRSAGRPPAVRALLPVHPDHTLTNAGLSQHPLHLWERLASAVSLHALDTLPALLPDAFVSHPCVLWERQKAWVWSVTLGCMVKKTQDGALLKKAAGGIHAYRYGSTVFVLENHQNQ